MSAKIYGITTDQIIPQSDFDASSTENAGVTVTQSFLIRKGGIDRSAIRSKFPVGTRITELDPNCDAYWSFCRLSKISSIKTVDGGYTMISAEFVGYTSPSFNQETGIPDPFPIYTMRSAMTEAPLSEHRKWKALDDDSKFALGLLINGDAISKPDFTSVGTYNEDTKVWSAWESTSGTIILAGDAIEFAKLIAQGQRTYMRPTVSYNHTWESDKPVQNSDIIKLGKITTPDGLPPSESSRTWILVGINQTQNGAGDFLYHNELEYIWSEADGHSTFLYES